MKPAEFKAVRRALRLSQSEAARVLNMPRAHVARIELGRYSVPPKLAERVQSLKEPT